MDALTPPPIPGGVSALSSGLPISAVAPAALPMPDPLAMAAEQIAKSAVLANASQRPRSVYHRVGESTRLFSNLNGIREDLTGQHTDANVKRALASRNPALRAVINTILSDVVSHFERPLAAKAVGARVVQLDKKKTPTKASVERAKYIEDVLFRGGVIRPGPGGEPGSWDAHEDQVGDPLPIAVRKLLMDSLTLDFGFIVTEPSEGRLNGGGHPVMHWHVEDGALIRFVDTKRYEPQVRTGWNGTDDISGRCKYVQLSPDNGYRVDREYAWDEGRHFIRNPRTNMLACGYGESEIEQCMMALVGVLYCLQANQDYFDKSHIPMGVLNLIGTYSPNDLSQLRLQLHQEVGYGSGGGLYDFPIIATPKEQGAGAQWLQMQDKTQFDGVGRLYIELCVALISAIFQVAPEEYGFSSFGGKTQVLSEADPESTIQHSKHRSVLPRVLSVCQFLNEGLVWQIDPNREFALEIQGLEDLYTGEALARADLEIKQQEAGYSMNMLRARSDEPPVIDPKDWVLWRQIEKSLEGEWFANDTLRTFAVLEKYEAAGGERCLWPDMPANQIMADVWKQEHGFQEQEQAQQDMSQMAQTEADSQRAGEEAEKQGAAASMDGMLASADERDAEEGAREREASAKDELRVPAMNDAGFHKAMGDTSNPSAAPSGRVVVRIGPR